MPQAPADYQVRYPIDFGDIDASVRQTVVQLYAADGGKSRGILYQPARGKPKTCVIIGASAGRVRTALLDSVLGRCGLRGLRA